MSRIGFVLLPLILLLTACSPALAEAAATTSATLPPTWTPTATATATPTFTPTPTATPTATATPTPTPTPITLPVTNGTPIPDLPYEVITAENVHRLRQIARYGYPRLLDEKPYRLTADGTTLVVGTTLGLEFYDASTQTKTGGFEVEFLRSFDLTPDGQYLLTLAGETLAVWTRDGQKVREFNLPIGDAWDLNPAALSPDGSMLAVQRKKTDWQEADKVEVYRTADGSLLDTVRGNGVLFSPDGQYLATVFDGSVRLYPAAELGQGWEKRLPKQTLPWCGDANERCGLAFSPDGTLAAVIRPSRVDVYQVEGRRLVRQVSGWEGDGYALPQVQVAPDGTQLLIVTPALYDRQGNVRVKAQAIVVDVASGEWLSRGEVEEGFAYLDKGRVRTFRWQAEGEMPTMYRYKISANIENNRLDLYVLGGQDFGLVHCTYDGCSKQSFDLPINEIPVYDENLEKYILQFYPRWVLSREEKVYLQFSGHSFAVPNAKISGNLLIVRAAESPQSSEMAVFDISTGKLLYRFSAHDFALSENKIYLFSPDNFVEIAGGNIQKHKSLEACNKLIHAEYALCTIFGGNSPSPELDAANILDFAFVKGDFLVAIYSDGFIRVWAVVPEDVSVR